MLVMWMLSLSWRRDSKIMLLQVLGMCEAAVHFIRWWQHEVDFVWCVVAYKQIVTERGRLCVWWVIAWYGMRWTVWWVTSWDDDDSARITYASIISITTPLINMTTPNHNHSKKQKRTGTFLLVILWEGSVHKDGRQRGKALDWFPGFPTEGVSL